MTREEILEALYQLLPAQFEDLLFRLAVPPQYLSGPGSPQSVRVIEVIRFFEGQRRLHELERSLSPVRTGRDATPQPEPPSGAAARAEQAALIKILFLAADPCDAGRLRVADEVREIERRIHSSKHRDRLAFVQGWAVTPDELLQTLLHHKPHIVHFSGHGAKGHGLVLQNADGKAVLVPPRALASLFKTLAATDNLCAVVLNACYSDEQAPAIAQHVDVVVGVSGEIGDRPACAFSSGFYTALADGRGLQQAFELGCIQIDLMGLPDAERPRFHVRPGTDPHLLTLR